MEAIINLWNSKMDFFLNLLWEHVQIALTAIVIAGIIGLIIGILISEYKKTSKVALGIVNLVYTIPSISLLGFLIPLSGIGDTTAIIALIIYALLPMVRSTHTGITNVDLQLIEAAKGMGCTRFQVLYKVKLPLALPVIMSGIRSMAVMTIALTGIASFIGAGGLGVAIYRGITTNNKAMTIIGSLLIALLALFFDFILGFVEKQMAKKRSKKQHKFVIIASAAVAVAALVFTYVFHFSDTKNTIHIATKPMSEQYIIGEMLHLLIEEDSDLKVSLTQGVGGGTSNIQPGMENKEFDLYPEYTGTGWNQVLKKGGLYSEALFSQLQKGYETYDMKWEAMLGFNNTFGIALRKDIAQQYNIKTFSDLAAISDQLIFGAEYDFFEREDGYDALVKKYGMRFKGTLDIDIGLKYDAINEQKVDAMIIFTTDGQLSTSNIVVLQDDQNLYPSYMCGLVVRNEVLKQYPELKTILKKLDGVISDDAMSKMNYQVENEKKEPKDVARAFLQEKGLLK